MIVSYRSNEHLDVKTTIGAAEVLLNLVQELPIRHLVALERDAFETKHLGERAERPFGASQSEGVVCAILALEEAVRLFHEHKREEARSEHEDDLRRLIGLPEGHG